MKCSRCGAEMKIKNIQVDTDTYGNPIYNKYAICYNCKTKRNLEHSKGSSGSLRNRSAVIAKRRKRKVRIIFSLIILSFVLIVAGCFLFFQKKSAEAERMKKKNTVVTETRHNKISTNSYLKLETGMTMDEVLDIIGSDGNKLMKAASEKSIVERYQWIADKGDGAVVLTFEDEKLINICQTDMITSDSVSLSEKSTKAIQTEMSYKDVKNKLGADGTRLSETLADGIVTSMYTWHDNISNKKLTVIFQNDKVQSVH